MFDKQFITTTLPYANSIPHIGHAFEFILGDAIARKKRKDNGFKKVIFNLGLDEHGLKIQTAAENAGVSPSVYLGNLNEKWLEFCELFEIKWDIFYRTSDTSHYNKVQRFWNECKERGDIYKKNYSGLYCVGCESFKSEKDLQNNKCPDHPETELVKTEEENYFFRLTNYKQEITKWADENKNFLIPHSKSTEFLNILKDTQDISISRPKDKVKWGVSVPDDNTQTIYVWFDALLNYIFAAGYYVDDVLFDEQWSNVIQICGPDNLRFQAIIFQGILASAKIKHTNSILIHGTVLDAQGRKMSKTLGNVIDPNDQIDKYGIDAVRYYTLSTLNTYKSGKWDEEELVTVYNSHLADNLGNLASRVLHLIDINNISIRYKDIKAVLSVFDPYDKEFCNKIETQLQEAEICLDEYDFNRALTIANKIVTDGNVYINDKQPWTLSKEDALPILHTLCILLTEVNERIYSFVIPSGSARLSLAIKAYKKAKVFPKIEKEYA